MSKPPQDVRAKLTELPADELVLAALERALCHRADPSSPAPIWSILEHLGVARRGAGARHVKSVLRRQLQSGEVASARPHGIEAWELTGAGRAHLRRARRKDSVPALPESPQHREWSNARRAAAQEIDRFRRALREHLEEASCLLDSEEEGNSDGWFQLAEALKRDCRRIGSARYCLHEWAEPSEELSDQDTRRDTGDETLAPEEQLRRMTLRQGRRNIRLWRDG